MKPFCEVIVSSILPAIRSMITKELLTTYNLTQKEAADILGLTQPAISQYKRESRGFKVKLLERQSKVMSMIDSLTKEIVSGKLKPRDIQIKFCKICRSVRESKAICHLHEEIYPSIAPCIKCPEQC